MKKIIEVKGGLGNQMFQFALYEKLKWMGYEAVLDDTKLCRHGNQHNGMDLMNAFPITYTRISKWQRLKYLGWRFHDAIIKRISVLHMENKILYDSEPTPVELILKDNIHYLRGYWQSPSYWLDIREQLLHSFSFNLSQIDDGITDLINKIQNENSVSLHVRRGDFLWPDNVEKRMGICTLDYYVHAVQYIEQSIGNCTFYIYTDDPKWVKDNFNNLNYILVDRNTGKYSYLDMYLMSISKHNIIANSTFSWWAAWLNRNPDKIVVCPNKWYNNMGSELIMDEWVKLE